MYNNNSNNQSQPDIHPSIAYSQQQQQQQQQQYNATTNTYSQLVQHPNFTNNRSPFFQVEKRCCVMPVFSQKRIQFRISLHSDDVNRILLKNGERGLHLRLFNFVSHEHQEWNSSQCDVSINNRKIIIDKWSTRCGVKKKGYNIVCPLDITKEACVTMDFEITSNGPFGGVAVIEIVRIFSVDEISARIIERCRPIDLKKNKKCAICGRKSDLLRCSRCKCVWYCGTAHQAKDWPAHQTICSPTELRQKLKSISWIESETKVSLRCPLSICRISIAIRGLQCTHPQCIDLKTFLSFSHKTGTWQCPVCLKPLQFNEIVIDNEMSAILKQTDEDVDLVRLYPNGSFKAITLQASTAEWLTVTVHYKNEVFDFKLNSAMEKLGNDNYLRLISDVGGQFGLTSKFYLVENLDSDELIIDDIDDIKSAFEDNVNSKKVHLYVKIEMRKDEFEAKNDGTKKLINDAQQKLKTWLENVVKLAEYYQVFIDEGIENLDDVIILEKQDLIEMGIKKVGHRKKILHQIKILTENGI